MRHNALFQKTRRYKTMPPYRPLGFRQSSFLNRTEALNSSSVKTHSVNESAGISSRYREVQFYAFYTDVIASLLQCRVLLELAVSARCRLCRSATQALAQLLREFDLNSSK
jgi:hypothetical protein